MLATVRDLAAREVPRSRLSILSDIPFPPGSFPVHEPAVFHQWFTIAAGVLGVLAGLGLTFGTTYLYPLRTGSLPVYSLPPFGIISYETMMWAALVTTVGGFAAMLLWRGKAQGRRLYSPDVQEDRIGLLVYCPNAVAFDEAIAVLEDTGVQALETAPGDHR